jgi:hypothetical protein
MIEQQSICSCDMVISVLLLCKGSFCSAKTVGLQIIWGCDLVRSKLLLCKILLGSAKVIGHHVDRP